MNKNVEEFLNKDFIEKFLGLDELLFEPSLRAGFINGLRPFYISRLNVLLSGNPYDMDSEDKRTMVIIAGRGYRRTGNNYPAIKLFNSFFIENEEKEFVDYLYELDARILETLFSNVKDNQNVEKCENDLINLAYLLKAVKDLPSEKENREALNEMYTSAKEGIGEIRLLCSVEL